MQTEPQAEHDTTLWTLILGPTIWSAHFLLSYTIAAVFCARGAAELDTARLWIGILTVLALAGIGVCLFLAWRQSGAGRGYEPPHEDDTTGDRHRFLGWATLLLSGLSFVATIYVALPTLLISTCV